MQKGAMLLRCFWNFVQGTTLLRFSCTFFARAKKDTKETTPLRGASRGFGHSRFLRKRGLAASVLSTTFMQTFYRA